MISKEVLAERYEGRHVVRLTIESGEFTVRLLNLGAILEDVVVPSQKGRISVVWKMPEVLQNITSPHYGQVIGRFANRIAKGRFSLNGTTFHLEQNNNGNALHGGQSDFGLHMWNVLPFDEQGDSVTLCYDSPDGDGGMPGNLFVTVTYTISSDGKLTLAYTATSDEDTPVNLTNHTYFNLSGGGSILDDEVQLSCPEMLEVDDQLIPTGKIRVVADTAYDFQIPKTIRKDMAGTPINGYDYCYVIGKEHRWPQSFGCLYDPKSGIEMHMRTTLPAVQFYTGNGLSGGVNAAGAGRNEGVCFETQSYPDAPNHPGFPSCIVKKGETLRTVTEYRFSVR